MQNALVPIDKLKATAEPVTVVTILNPFRPYDRTILRKDWQPGKGIDYYTGYLPVLADVELVASVNGKVVRDWSQVDVNPGDFIAVCPLVAGGGGGKKIGQFPSHRCAFRVFRLFRILAQSRPQTSIWRGVALL